MSSHSTTESQVSPSKHVSEILITATLGFFVSPPLLAIYPISAIISCDQNGHFRMDYRYQVDVSNPATVLCDQNV